MRFSIKLKLFISTIIPIIALSTFSLFHAQTQVNKIDQIDQLASSINTADILNRFLHETQLERGLSTLYYFDKSLKEDFLINKNLQTNSRLGDLLSLIHTIKDDHSLELVSNEFKTLLERVEKLEEIRIQIKQRTIQPTALYSYYTDLNINILNIIKAIPIHHTNVALYYKTSTFLQSIYLEESLGQERAIVTKIASIKRLDLHDNTQYFKIQAEKARLIKNIYNKNFYYSDHAKEKFNSFIDSSTSKSVNAFLEPIKEYKLKLFRLHQKEKTSHQELLELRSSLLILDPHRWIDMITKNINHLHKYDKLLKTELMNDLQHIKGKEERHLEDQLVFTFSIILFLLLFNYYLANLMLRSITLLKNGLHNFFSYLHLDTQTAEDIKIISSDEFSEMANAINAEMKKLQEQFEIDQEFIMEVTHIADLMSEGDFSEKIYFDANNPNLIKLKEVFNNLLNLIQQKIDAQSDEMQMINNSLETQVYQQTLTLEENLRELSAFKLAINESLMFMKVDINKGILDINEAMLSKFTYSKEAMLGHIPNDFLSPDYFEDTREEVLTVVKEKKIYHGVIGWHDAAGEEFFTDSHIIPILKRNADVDYLLALFHDITPIIHARDKAIMAEKSKDEFLSNMSHEIRTPLNAILGFVGILQKHSLDEKSLHYLDIINSSSNSLLGIINDILDFSKIQSGKFLIEKRAFSPVQVISNTILLFASKAYEKDIHLLSYIDPNLPPALIGDEIRIKQVLSNLLSNALKFSPEGSSIRLRVVYKNDELHVDVKDEGIGIAKENQDRVFKAFEQADGSTTREFGGTGLGLSISAHLVGLMNGKISVSSTLGEGSTFSFALNILSSNELSAQETHIEKIKKLSIALLRDESNYAMTDLLEKYFKDYGVENFTTYNQITEIHADLLIFVASKEINESIKSLQIPSIALHTKPSRIFDHSSHIYNLNAPFVPRLVLEALDDATIERLRIDEEIEKIEDLSFKARILVAEDNKTNQMLITLLLEDYGIEYEVADDGDIAVEMFKKDHNFDLILMDENMPNLNGLAAMKLIKAYIKETAMKSIPIVSLTANAMQGDRERFLKEGMDDFITKPIETTELERIFKKYFTVKEDV